MSGRAGGGGAPVVGNRVRRGLYLDSVALMRLSTSLAARAGVERASLLIGTPSNLATLAVAGLLTEDGRVARPNDLVVAVRAAGEEALTAALEAAEAGLDGTAAGTGGSGGEAAGRHLGLSAACEALPDANLAIVSVPGPFAAREARRALARGLHVLVFSDNVPVEQEVALKREGRARGRLVMGPDCGTALIAGTPLAFANRVRRGVIGIVSASGTGLQELSVLLHRGGGGVSHGIGVGGRDLGDEVGGLGTFMALDALEADPGTEHVAIVSKPPGPRTEAALLARLAGFAKPVTVCLVGGDDGAAPPPNVTLALTLRDAARFALGASSGSGDPARRDRGGPSGRVPVGGVPGGWRGDRIEGPATAAAGGSAPGPGAPPPSSRPRRIVGLFAGGTLCAEAQAILRRSGLDVTSNAPIPGVVRLDLPSARSGRAVTPHRSLPSEPGPPDAANALPGPSIPSPSEIVMAAAGHVLLDLGADEYTAGRPHPMIEPAMRTAAFADALADPTVAVVVLDVVLGTGSHPDPAAPIAAVLCAAPPAGRPVVIASVCGTELDPQDYAAQRLTLESAGVLVADSNADAAQAAIRVVTLRPVDARR